MFEKVLVAIDGSDEGKSALTAAISIAKRFRSALQGIYIKKRLSRYLFAVAEVIEEKEEMDVSALLVTEGARDLAEREEVLLNGDIRLGHPVQAIINFARERYFDLLVIAPTSRDRVFGKIWRATPQRFARVAPCSVR